MKIHGPNHSKMNPYQKLQQIEKQTASKSHSLKPDQLQISDEALKMQQKDSRQAYVNEIKQQVDNGEYNVNNKETAKKLLNYWKA